MMMCADTRVASSRPGGEPARLQASPPRRRGAARAAGARRRTLAVGALALGLVGLVAAPARAGTWSSHDVGLGVTLGSPTGIDAKFGLGGIHAIDAWFGLHFLLHDAIGIGAEYNAEIFTFTAGRSHDGLYVGAGGMFTFLDHAVYHGHKDGEVDVGFGVRVPFGVDFVLNAAPVNFFGEIAPGFTVVTHHGVDFLFDIAVGVRFIL